MKPHELIQRRRQNRRGGKSAPPQMRDRNAAAGTGAAPAGPGGIIPIPPDDPRTRMPARRPTFAGETRAQELDRQRASAPIARVLPEAVGAGAAVPAPSTIRQPAPQQPAAQPAQPVQPAHQPQNVITMCACTSHGDSDCDNVASLRLVWPNTEGNGWGALVDVCEECAAAIKADPVASLVTGLAFLPLYPPMHDPIEDEEDLPAVATAAGNGGTP